MSNRLLIGRVVLWSFVALVAGATVWFLQTASQSEPPAKVVLITADADPYWDRLIDGAEDAAQKFDVQLSVMRADGSISDQTKMINAALEGGYDGMAVSPVDASKQGLQLKQVAMTRPLITVDSDSEFSQRLCFVGTDNYSAGRRCGELVKAALPDGGRIAIVMGPILKANGERRRQGIIDELLDRSYGPGRPTDPLDEELAGGAYTIAATLIDEINAEDATANVRAALEADATINCVVGLYAYSTPAALEAVEALGRLDGVTLIGFDDREETLQAIADGKVHATLVQDQYSYGYDTIRLLSDAVRGREAIAIPINEAIHFPPSIVTAENVEAFRLGQKPIN